LFNRLAVVISDRVDVHWQNPDVNRYIQRNVFETLLISSSTCLSYSHQSALREHMQREVQGL